MLAVHAASLEVVVPDRESVLVPELGVAVQERLRELDRIGDERRAALEAVVNDVSSRTGEGRPARLVFICSHNSRRSHMAQLWAEVAARHFSIDGLEFFSGGTEITAFNPRAVAALRRAGFVIEPFTDGKNPIYEVRFEQEMEPIQAYSKVYDEPPNPGAEFTAVMTCSEADAGCPIVHGADRRIPVFYDDPKEADGTLQEAEIYDERCRQIAREMLYIFSRVARRT